MSELHYLDGKWVTEADCKISAFDLTVLRGYGAFDFLRTYHKKPFLLDDHIDRLYNSAKELGLTVKQPKAEIAAIVHEGIRRSSFDEIYIKVLFTGGISADGITPGSPSLIVLFLKAASYPEEYSTKGVALRSIRFERPLPTAKSLNYMTAVVELQKAKKDGYQDVLYISYDGFVLEGTTVNFFGVRGGEVYTTEEGILYGCTRKHLLKIAKELNVKVHVSAMKQIELALLEEAFISSTTRELHPVIRIDQQQIGSGTPGPITRMLMAAFAASRNE